MEPRDDIEVPRIRKEDLSPALLREAIGCPTPIVLEGMVEDCDAVRTWSPEFFRSNYGDVVVPAFFGSEGRSHMTVAEIIDGFPLSVKGGPAMNNVTDLLLRTPELRDAVPLDLLRRWSGERFHGAQLFIAAKGGGSTYHCANELNIFLMIDGEKDWYFVHPRHSMWLDPLFDARSGTYAAAVWPRTTGWDERPSGVPMMHAHLRPGDVLLNPPWWWHLVKNRTDSVAVATRWRRWRFRFGTQNPLFSTMQWLVPNQWRIMWNDYLRGGELTDAKLVNSFSNTHRGRS